MILNHLLVEHPIELHIPSKFGYEKVAVNCVACFALNVGFTQSRIDDLKTAVYEACLNAIEHGNKMDQSIDVIIRISSNEKAIFIEIQDFGVNSFKISYEKPNLNKKINGKENPRGWGLFLIKNLVDEVKIKTIPNKGNILEMTLYLKKNHNIKLFS